MDLRTANHRILVNVLYYYTRERKVLKLLIQLHNRNTEKCKEEECIVDYTNVVCFTTVLHTKNNCGEEITYKQLIICWSM